MAARPGVALKLLRQKNSWTLSDVSERTGVPASTLSRIENDAVSPTYDLLVRLSSGLNIDLAQLLAMSDEPERAQVGQSGRRSVNRVNDGEVVEMPDHTLRYLSTDLIKKQFTPILCEYRARSLAEFGDFMRHEGEEFLLVIEGKLELHTRVYKPLVLATGESVYFDSRMDHAYVAAEQPCRALSICTAPPANEADDGAEQRRVAEVGDKPGKAAPRGRTAAARQPRVR